MTDEGAVRLGIAIIAYACDDYITGKESESKFINFCKSDLFSMITDCDPDYLITKVRRERRLYLYGDEKRKRAFCSY